MMFNLHLSFSLSSLITEVAVAAMSVALQGMLADESITIDSLCSGRLF